LTGSYSFVNLNNFSKRLYKKVSEDSETRNIISTKTETRLFKPKEVIKMDDLDKFIKEEKRLDPEFQKGFQEGYRNFKIGVLLHQARQEAGLTQDEIAKKLKTKKSAISRIENHAEDIRLSTLYKYAGALGKSLHVFIR